MDFSISQLLVLLFFLLPLIERFLGKKKGQQTQHPEPDGIEIEAHLPEMTWEETLEHLETVLKGEAQPSPAPVQPKPAHSTRALEAAVGPEFKSMAPKSPMTDEERQQLYSPFAVVDDAAGVAVEIRLDRQHLRESVVVNEILSRPLALRRRSA